jgi:hypothetical protein
VPGNRQPVRQERGIGAIGAIVGPYQSPKRPMEFVAFAAKPPDIRAQRVLDASVARGLGGLLTHGASRLVLSHSAGIYTTRGAPPARKKIPSDISDIATAGASGDGGAHRETWLATQCYPSLHKGRTEQAT